MNTQKILPSIAGALLLIAILAACKKDLVTTDDALGLIPQEAFSVVRVDIPALLKKSDFETIRESDMFREAVADAREDNPTLAKVMENRNRRGRPQ
ncbi:MAG: hypothetical protein IPJ40_04790 [Saprospirales bacterium]|nr:hypothetical protein [Saprospirales bacterium]